MAKQLYRLVNNKIFLGICSGFAEYIGWDKTIVRLLFIFIVFLTGIFPMVVLYFVAYFIMPVDNNNSSNFIR